LKTKDETLNCFKTYKAEVENQLEKKIKRFMSDCCGEYFSNEFHLFCAEHGCLHGGGSFIDLVNPNQRGCRKKESHIN
jgi:hypothetical protein